MDFKGALRMKTIKFSHDWNNKITGPQKVFTTIRKHDEAKEKYYTKSKGEIFEVQLGEKKVGEAKLVEVNLIKLEHINLPFLMVDTGYTDPEKIMKLFKNFGVNLGENVIVLIFEKGNL
jgi:hypothetical protein